jgi:hypothetical protein
MNAPVSRVDAGLPARYDMVLGVRHCPGVWRCAAAPAVATNAAGAGMTHVVTESCIQCRYTDCFSAWRTGRIDRR